MPQEVTTTEPEVNISGRLLEKRRVRMSATFRALLAVEIAEESMLLRQLTGKQARALTGASSGYFRTVKRCSSEQRVAIGCGRLSLSSLHAAKPVPTDAQVDTIVKKIGIERVFDSLDRLTATAAPSTAAAA
jgi:hypothetical protein